MLDKINYNSLEALEQSQNLEKIRGLGVTNPFRNDSDYFIDESNISFEALKRYQNEMDIKEFGNLLKQTDQKESDELVLQKAFDGLLSIDNDEFLEELLSNEDFLNDVTKQA